MSAHTQGAGGGSRWRVAFWSTAGILLLIPLIAMQFSKEVQWGPFDFLVMGAMLAGVGGSCELAVRKSGHTAYRAGFGLALLACFLLIWLNVAVGMIGNEDD